MEKAKIESYSKKRIRWGSIAFFLVLALIPLIGIPFYVAYYGWRWADFALFAGYAFLTVLAVTAGYHRLYSHRAFNANQVSVRYDLACLCQRAAVAIEKHHIREVSICKHDSREIFQCSKIIVSDVQLTDRLEERRH